MLAIKSWCTVAVKRAWIQKLLALNFSSVMNLLNGLKQLSPSLSRLKYWDNNVSLPYAFVLRITSG